MFYLFYNICKFRQDFDKDGRADCVGVHVSGIGVIRSVEFCQAQVPLSTLIGLL